MFSDELKKFRLIPVVVIDNSQDAAPLADAIVSGGLQCVEITLRTEGALESLQIMARRSDLVVGAGTVLSVEQAKAAMDNGARFVVSPGMSSKLVEWCQKYEVPVFPGCATPSEIQLAMELGLPTVKFFPAEQLGGVKMLETLSGVFQSVQFMPTGGISAENLLSYLSIPQVVACGGSWMVKAEWVREHHFTTIRAAIAQAVELLD